MREFLAAAICGILVALLVYCESSEKEKIRQAYLKCIEITHNQLECKEGLK